MAETSARNRQQPGPATLRGVEGFFVLTADGGIGRYKADGRFIPEPRLSRGLSEKIARLLRQYRQGGVPEIALGLVTADIPDRPWRTASLVFTDHALRELYRTGGDPNAPLTNFQKRNRIKSLFQGMEVMLDATDPSQPEYPRYCPLLFAPEVSAATLNERYGVEGVDPRRTFEVLDLMGPLDPEERRAPVFNQMVTEVSRSRISPELRSGPDLMVAAGAGPEIEKPQFGGGQSDEPWGHEEEEQRSISFHDGDPVPYWLLAWFSPFNQLNDLQRQFIARGLKIAKRAPGTTFIESGSKADISLYLVEGTLELQAFDGRTISITGGTKRAQLPVSQLSPHAFTVKAETAVTVIPVSQSMVREVMRITTTYGSRTGIEVTEEDALPDDITPGSGASIDYEGEGGR